MLVVVDEDKLVGTKIVDGREYEVHRYTFHGNGTAQEAKAAGWFENGMWEDNYIAHGSAYCDVHTFDIVLYDEVNDLWGGE